VFTRNFWRVDNQAQRERTCETCVFEDSFGSDEDVKEGDEEKMMRMVRGKVRSRPLLAAEIVTIPDKWDAITTRSADLVHLFTTSTREANQHHTVGLILTSTNPKSSSLPSPGTQIPLSFKKNIILSDKLEIQEVIFFWPSKSYMKCQGGG
jgi:hypothetical protein